MNINLKITQEHLGIARLMAARFIVCLCLVYVAVALLVFSSGIDEERIVSMTKEDIATSLVNTHFYLLCLSGFTSAGVCFMRWKVEQNARLHGKSVGRESMDALSEMFYETVQFWKREGWARLGRITCITIVVLLAIAGLFIDVGWLLGKTGDPDFEREFMQFVWAMPLIVLGVVLIRPAIQMDEDENAVSKTERKESES